MRMQVDEDDTQRMCCLGNINIEQNYYQKSLQIKEGFLE